LTHIILSFQIEELVEFIKIKQLVVIGFLMIAMMAMEVVFSKKLILTLLFQDVVVDGWVTS